MKNIFTVLGLIILNALFSADGTIAQGTWTQKADFPADGVSQLGSFSIDTKCYIVGNPDNFWEWNQATNVWTKKVDFPGESTDGAVGFSIGTKGYIGTGGDSNELWEYDPLADSWTQMASLPDTIGRSYAIGFSIGTKGYIGLGRKSLSDGSNYYKDFWEWDQATNAWTQKADFDGPARAYAVGFSIGTKGYVGTGEYSADSLHYYYKDFWEWDQATNVWTQKADLDGSERHAAVGLSIGNKGYIGLGFAGHIISFNDFWEWNPETNTWTQEADYRGIGPFRAVGLSIGDLGYIGLGSSLNGNDQAFWEFDPSEVSDSLIDVVPDGAIVNKLSSDQYIFLEGPVWYNDSILLFIEDGIGSPNIFQYNPESKQVGPWPSSSTHCVGLTLDRDGNLIGTSWNIIMINNAGQVTKTVASEYNGKPFNNPNDLIADKKGGVYFSDPDFFLTTLPQGKTAVYYIDSTRIVKRVIDDLAKPNGLVLSPDGTKLYVVDTEIKYLYSWTVASDGSLSDKSTFAELDTIEGGNNYADGMAIDIHGNIYVATSTGIQVFTPQGDAITTIAVPENPSNCDFGGKDFKTLYITAHKNIYSIDLNYPGYAVSRKEIPNWVPPVTNQPLMEVYPNPTNGLLYIRHNLGKINSIDIVNMEGKKETILLNNQGADAFELNVRQLNSGMYMLRIVTDAGVVNRKFVKEQ